MLAVTAGMSVRGETQSQHDSIGLQDSTIDVIAWFSKHDTVTYWVSNSSWNISESDTTRTASVSMMVRINVVDSTPKGYKMDYTFLEFPIDTLSDSTSSLARFQNQITARLMNKIVGTTVHFETDEYGHITKYNNLGQIKKQAKSLFKEAMKEFAQLPEIQGLKDMGLDLKGYLKKVDTDELVDGYLEELNLLFLFHGRSMSIGEFTEHEDATESSFENTTYSSVYVDADDDAYHILYDVTNILPQNELKALVGGIIESFSNDSITESFNDNFDAQVKADGTYEDYLKADFLVNGWPYAVVRQKATMIGNHGKIKQTTILLDSYSFGQ